MGALMRSIDWSTTPIGAVSLWSPALRMMVGFMLANRFPMLLWWGPRFVQLYNDTYRPVLGAKHPKSMGQPGSECWPEIWNVIGPLAEKPFRGGEATWMEDIFLELNRHGFVEETHFTISYSPVPDDSAPRGIGGVAATVHEITEKVVGERRGRLLRELGARSTEAKTAEDACSIAAGILAGHPEDVPFALLYLIDSDRKYARLAGTAGIASSERAASLTIDLRQEGPWPLSAALHQQAMQTVVNLSEAFERVPPGPWSDPPASAVVLPIHSPQQIAGFLVSGVSSRLRFDSSYRDFCDLMTNQLAMAIANARGYEEERRRAEALAEIDRAKTAFFNNISHEFRTPLTLMLGPLQDLIERPDRHPGATRDELSLVYRNAQRLLKLVNTLLDFSRLEAGRIQATYEPVDLAALTAELASVFRAAVEKAGLRLLVDCAPLPQPVYIDQSMWEKVVLNLLSNAFKFTFEGEILVTIRERDNRAELIVSDTGIGIAENELPHLFDRFHRVQGARGRTHEGSGIGLALVKDLVKLHGGEVRVESVAGDGSTFTVMLPFGSEHLPREQVREKAATTYAATGNAYVQEALSWLPDHSNEIHASEPEPHLNLVPARPEDSHEGARLLVADDNADMRLYLERLLARHYRVQVVADGEAALQAALSDPPDLILTDIMMPRRDGLALVEALRADARTRTIPVIVLSARASGDRQMEGLEAGANDYLVKPFHARELLARIATQLEMMRLRREALEKERELRRDADLHGAQFETLLNNAPLGVYLIDGHFRIRQVNPTARAVFGDITDLIGRDFGDVIRILWPKKMADELVALFRHTLETGESYYEPERSDQRVDRGDREYYQWQINRIQLPDGGFGVVCYFQDISNQVLARMAAIESEERFRTLANHMSQLAWMADSNMRAFWFNQRWYDYTGTTEDEMMGLSSRQVCHPDHLERVVKHVKECFDAGEVWEDTYPLRAKDGSYRWFLSRAVPIRSEDGTIVRWFGTNTDITELREVEQQLRRANYDLEQFAYSASHDLQEPLRMITSFSQMLVKSYPGTLDGEAALCVGFISEGSKRMRELLSDLLAYTQVNDVPAEEEFVDLNEVYRKALLNLKTAVEESGAVVESSRLPVVKGHEGPFLQLFQNLLANAIKYRGEIAPRIQVGTEESGGAWVVCVADNGIGIAPEYYANIFGVFKRLHGKEIPGTGIGLAICQRVVESYGGRIWVESEINRGSRFYFTLPKAERGDK